MRRGDVPAALTPGEVSAELVRIVGEVERVQADAYDLVSFATGISPAAVLALVDVLHSVGDLPPKVAAAFAAIEAPGLVDLGSKLRLLADAVERAASGASMAAKAAGADELEETS